jgi:hypothetical protein
MDPVEVYNHRVTEEVERRRNRRLRKDMTYTYEELTKLSVRDLEAKVRTLWIKSENLQDEVDRTSTIKDKLRITLEIGKIQKLGLAIVRNILPPKRATLKKEAEMKMENIRIADERKRREARERAGLPVTPMKVQRTNRKTRRPYSISSKRKPVKPPELYTSI